MFSKPITKKIGDCDACPDAVNVETYISSNKKMWLCEGCLNKEKAAEANQVKQAEARQIITQFRQTDGQIQLSTDLNNQESIPIIELRAAIEANDEIPANLKEYTFVKMCQEHFMTLQEEVISDRAKLRAKEHARDAWRVNGQSACGKLSAELQAEFVNLQLDYKPSAPKLTKVASTEPKYTKGLLEEIKKAAAKFGVDVPMVRATMRIRKISAEAAARVVAETETKLKLDAESSN
jgi:hypothetical protein